jgi:hypothetical protein
MNYFGLLGAALMLQACEPRTFCTEEFRSVGFTWTGANLPSKVTTVNWRTGDTLIILDEGYERFFAVVDDGSMNALSFEGDSLFVRVQDSLGTQLSTAWYVVGRDDCHIIYRSGPEFLP